MVGWCTHAPAAHTRAAHGREIIATGPRPRAPRAIDTPRRHPRRRVASLLAASLVLLVMLGGLPGPAAAATTTPTADTMGTVVLGWLNRDRAARGLVPLRSWTPLQSMAADRAARMAEADTLSHAAAGGNVGTELSARGLRWYAYGEIIGASTYPWGSQAAANIYSLWKASPSHRPIMFSARYNYVGVGFVYRPASNTTYASVVFSESKDHTGAVARNGTLSRTGTDGQVLLVRLRPAAPDPHGRPALVRRPVPGGRRRLADDQERHDENRAHAVRPAARPLVRVPRPGGRPAR